VSNTADTALALAPSEQEMFNTELINNEMLQLLLFGTRSVITEENSPYGVSVLSVSLKAVCLEICGSSG